MGYVPCPISIPTASLEDRGRGTVHLLAVGRQAEWQAGRAVREETPPHPKRPE